MCNFPTRNIRNGWRARGDGHFHNVTSKCCGVTITTTLVEWTLSFSEIKVLFGSFQAKCQTSKKTNDHANKVCVGGGGGGGGGQNDMGGRYCVINLPLGPRWRRTSWWVNCAIPATHVVFRYKNLVPYHSQFTSTAIDVGLWGSISISQDTMRCDC